MCSTLNSRDQIVSLISEGKNVRVLAVAGSGKTTSILYVAKANPNKKILVLTYNKKLQIETAERAISLSNVSVYTLHGYCGHINNEICLDDSKLVYKSPDTIVYDLIVVDEMQDFTKRYYEFVHDVIQGNGKCQLLFLGDKNQMIYEYKGGTSSYLEDPDKFFGTSFNSVSMNISHRISKQMCNFINVAFPNISIKAEKEGTKPFYYQTSMNKSLSIIAEDINKKIEKGYLCSDFFILMWSVTSQLEKKDWNDITEKMDKANIPVYVQSNDDETPSERLTNGKVVMCTFHKTKGLERKIIYILGFDKNHSIKYQCDETNLLYVASTRALEELHLFQTHKEPWLTMEQIIDVCNIVVEKDIKYNDKPISKMISVTNICSHKAFEKINKIYSRTTIIPTMTREKEIILPVFTKSKYVGLIEEISDILGICIIDYFKHYIYQEWKNMKFKDLVKDEISNCKMNKKYKQYQITQYNWIKQKTIDIITKRLSTAVKRKCTSDVFEKEIICDTFSDKYDQIVGRIDLLTRDSIYEFKCTKTQKIEHFIQLLLYGKMYEKKYGDKRLMKLYYPLCDMTYTIDTDLTFDEMIEILTNDKK